MTELKQTFDLIYVGVLIVIAVASFFGGNAFFAKKIIANADAKHEEDKIERAEAKKAAEEREEARMQVIIGLQESFVAVGHVAQKTAEAHLSKCGPNKGISDALNTYNEVRAKTEERTRQEAAKYREERRGA